MKRPKISVVVTTFERPKRLRKALKSVKNQTFKDWECIIVDDGSKDETPDVCAEFLEDKRFRCIQRKKNFGQHTRPKNEGTKAAKADLIAYLDDDNEYYPEHLDVLYKNKGKDVTMW